MPVEQVDRAIVGKVIADLTSPEFVAEALQVTKYLLGRDHSSEIEKLKRNDDEIEKQISKFLDMASELDTPGPILRKVDELERERKLMAAEISRLEANDQQAEEANNLNEASVSRMLNTLANELQEYDREALKDFLGTMLDHIDLDPEAMSCQLHYRISVPRRNKLASPRRYEPTPVIEWESIAELVPRWGRTQPKVATISILGATERTIF